MSATEQDLGDYRAWRCRAPQNPVRVGGSKWNREAAAFTKLFRWAGVVPLPVDVSRPVDRAADSASARVAWLTRQAADYLARDGLVLFDNPDGCLICVFKRDAALCEPGPGATAPSQHDCRPGCGNAVRTDQHAQDLRQRAARTDQLAEHAPAPVARRLRAAADRDRAAAGAHDAAAQPAGTLA